MSKRTKRVFGRVDKHTHAADRWAAAMNYERELDVHGARGAARAYADERNIKGTKDRKEIERAFIAAGARAIRRISDEIGDSDDEIDAIYRDQLPNTSGSL